MLAAGGAAAEDMNHAGMAGMSGGSMSDDAASAVPENAAKAKLGSLVLTDGYLKAMVPGQPVGGGFVTIRNDGKEPDKLVSISTPLSTRGELHEMSMQGSIMKMRKVPDDFAIAPGQTLTMEPGGYHLMFMGMKMPFKAGDTVTVTLTFEKAGKVDLAMPVVKIHGRM